MNPKCLYPFIFLEFHARGEVFACCPAWTRFGPIGNLYRQSIEEIWNGARIRKLRKKIYDNRYRSTCRAGYCPFLHQPIDFNQTIAKASPDLQTIINQIKQRKTILKNGPLKISLAHSGICNLRCQMCLSNSDFNPPEPKLDRLIFKQVIPSLLPGLEVIKLGGNGDPFFQPQTLAFLKNFPAEKYPRLRFQILTNGLLFDSKLWPKIKHNHFECLDISIDAADQKVYQKIRRGGQWPVLLKNLRFFSSLRKRKRIDCFIINFTVMRANYHQMADFVRLGLKFGCDQIRFNRIFGFRHLENIEENINLFPDPKILLEIKKILQNPLFKNSRVNLSNIKDYCHYQPAQLAIPRFKSKLIFFKLARNILKH
ncbi:MAG: radical SAM protein [Candidatus Pacebacteria bacterium]|nr:radical SAM protein [Candidatus Paceibacterota bacterium]